MPWHESDTWWKQIPERINLRSADVEVINSQKFDPRNSVQNVDDILDDTLVAVFFISCFKKTMDEKVSLNNWVWDHIQSRGNLAGYEVQGGFNLKGLTIEEMGLRVERAQLNLSILRGIEKIEDLKFYSKLEDTPLTRYSDSHSYKSDAFLKVLNSMPDDEISELAALAESRLIEWMPAIKEILIEAYDRSKSNKWA